MSSLAVRARPFPSSFAGDSGRKRPVRVLAASQDRRLLGQILGGLRQDGRYPFHVARVEEPHLVAEAIKRHWPEVLIVDSGFSRTEETGIEAAMRHLGSTAELIVIERDEPRRRRRSVRMAERDQVVRMNGRTLVAADVVADSERFADITRQLAILSRRNEREPEKLDSTLERLAARVAGG